MGQEFDVREAVEKLGEEGRTIAVKVFKKSLGNVQYVAQQLAPVGHYERARGYEGRSGGALQNSLTVRLTRNTPGLVEAQCTSNLPYAQRQHEGTYFHPGQYTRGAAGPRYRAAFFERAAAMIFSENGDGRDPLGDPGHQLRGVRVVTFKELLEDAQAG